MVWNTCINRIIDDLIASFMALDQCYMNVNVMK